MNSKKVIVALDNNNINKTIKLVNELKSEAYAFKIGYEFFLNYGITGYKKIKKITPNIFLDLKLHDIPNTVRNGIKAIDKLRPILTTIHISGGEEMMKASQIDRKYTKIWCFNTTSLDSAQTKKFYNEKNIKNLVIKFVKYAKKQKIDGIVCSPKEIKYIRKLVGKNFIIVTPGITISDQNYRDDQKRVLNPKKQAKANLVIGRPIMQSKNPLKTVKEINESLI